MTCSKKRYRSERAAKDARRQFASAKASAYFCRSCCAWHLTTWKKP